MIALNDQQRRRLLAAIRGRMGQAVRAFYEPEDILQDVLCQAHIERTKGRAIDLPHANRRAGQHREDGAWNGGEPEGRLSQRLHANESDREESDRSEPDRTGLDRIGLDGTGLDRTASASPVSDRSAGRGPKREGPGIDGTVGESSDRDGEVSMPWLLAMAHHRILTLARSLKPRKRPQRQTALPPTMWQHREVLPNEKAGERNHVQMSADREACEAGCQALANLEDKRRVVLVLRNIIGAPWPVIGFLTARPPESARKWHQRSQRWLQPFDPFAGDQELDTP